MEKNGIIESLNNGKVVVKIVESSQGCSHCALKAICKPDTSGAKIELNIEKADLNVGENVRIKLNEGMSVLFSFLLFIMPIFVLIFSYLLFEKTGISELIRIILSFFSSVVYFLFISFIENKLISTLSIEKK